MSTKSTKNRLASTVKADNGKNDPEIEYRFSDRGYVRALGRLEKATDDFSSVIVTAKRVSDVVGGKIEPLNEEDGDDCLTLYPELPSMLVKVQSNVSKARAIVRSKDTTVKMNRTNARKLNRLARQWNGTSDKDAKEAVSLSIAELIENIGS